MQKWEYLFILRRRGWKAKDRGEFWHNADVWKDKIVTTTGSKNFPYKDLPEALTKLGDEGWELVAISDKSSTLGGYHREEESGIPGSTATMAADFAGFTSEEEWIFKRPKE